MINTAVAQQPRDSSKGNRRHRSPVNLAPLAPTPNKFFVDGNWTNRTFLVTGPRRNAQSF